MAGVWATRRTGGLPLKNPDEFLRHHRAYHQQQRARVLLLRIAFGFAFVAVVAMVVIAFR